jgi:hypothetical protein
VSYIRQYGRDISGLEFLSEERWRKETKEDEGLTAAVLLGAGGEVRLTVEC